MFEIGDVIRVGCPFTPARVVEVRPDEITVEWPWGRLDPDSGIRWDGCRVIPRGRGGGEWGGLFELAPQATEPRAGDTCRVGIPEALFRIVDIGRYDPPMDVGWLPRPHTLLIVVPLDHPYDPDGPEEGDTIELESAPPLTIERIS
jgi:hypothetical protein